MEHAPWKPILIAVIASFLLLFTIYFIITPKTGDLDTGEHIEKIIEFKETFVAGHEEGRKSWRFYAEYGWAGKNKQVTHLEKVTEGTVYDKEGYLLLTDLVAQKVKAYRHTKNIEAYGINEDLKKEPLKAYIAIAKKKKGQKRKFAFLKADQLKYYDKTEKTELSGHIYIKEKNLSLWADNMSIDHKNETATLKGNIFAKREDIDLSCSELSYDSGKEELTAKDNLTVKISGKSPAEVKANQMRMSNNPDRDVYISGSIKIVQGKKIAVAQNAKYNKNRKNIALSGKVKTVIEKGKAILNENTVTKLKNKEAKTLLENKTLLNSDELLISTDNGNARAAGNVFVYQKGNQAKSNKAIYLEKSETMALTGNVYMMKDGKWVKADKVNVSVKDETFEAIGSVEAKFKLEVN